MPTRCRERVTNVSAAKTRACVRRDGIPSLFSLIYSERRANFGVTDGYFGGKLRNYGGVCRVL